jgi:hypothetical protein
MFSTVHPLSVRDGRKIIGATPTIFKELEDKPVKDSRKKVYSLVTHPTTSGLQKLHHKIGP